jgi:DNA polymerase III epsilon subunit
MQPLDEQILAAFDVETTGLSAFFGDRICEVGLVRARGDEILDNYQTLVNPQRSISPGAARVNGLSDEQVRQAPPFSEIATQVLALLDGALLVCHNAPFDLSFLEAELSRLGQTCQLLGVIDTLDIARRYFNFASNSLSAVASRLEIETPQSHRALGDAQTTLQVFRHFYRQLVGRGVVQPWDLVGAYRPASSPRGLSRLSTTMSTWSPSATCARPSAAFASTASLPSACWVSCVARRQD